MLHFISLASLLVDTLGEAPAIDVTAGCRQALGLSVSFSCLSGRQMLAERCMAHMYVCV
jgi:hypothetical protein